MHLRIFGCKCDVHNNGKDTLGKFDPRSDEAILLGYSLYSKAYKVFNKRTLCVEESVHILFDESNSLIENGVQDEDFELGLAKKDCLPNQEGSKNPQEGSGTVPVSKAERRDSESESRARTGTETGPVTVSELGSSYNQAGDRPISRS